MKDERRYTHVDQFIKEIDNHEKAMEKFYKKIRKESEKTPGIQ